jgi:signal peptidase II
MLPETVRSGSLPRRLLVFKWSWLTIFAIVLDQVSKITVDHLMHLYQSIPVLPSFNITYVHNYGAAFSFLSDADGWQRWLFTFLATAVSVVIAVWLARLKKHETLLAVSLALILGGAIGNLIDRVAYGYVIDFIDVYYQAWHFPVFNIADSAISLGVFLMILESLGIGKQLETESTERNI